MRGFEPHRARGVTLVELMIVIIVIAILASIAVPSYRNYVLRTHRTDATAALLKVRAAQERFFLQNNSYITAAAGLIQAPPGGFGFRTDDGVNAVTEHGYYQLGVGLDPTAPAGVPSFQVSAVPIGGQLDDTDCRTVTINDRGQRGATNAGGATGQAIIDTCWR